RAPSNLQIVSVDRHDHNRSNITIAWKCNNAYTAQGFSVERSTDGSNFIPLDTVDTTVTSFTEEKLPGGTYFYRVRSFNAQGNSLYSNVDSVRIGGGDQPTPIDHSAGVARNSHLTKNGSVSYSGTAARLTDGGFGEAGTVFSSNRVGISNFTTTFTFQIRPGTTPMADGMVFIIQGVSPTALGPAGGGLAYGPDQPGPGRG